MIARRDMGIRRDGSAVYVGTPRPLADDFVPSGEGPVTPCACLSPRRTSQVTVVLTLEHDADVNLERAVQRALDHASEALDTELQARDVELANLRVGTVAYGAGGGAGGGK